jgi:hypothetical protein
MWGTGGGEESAANEASPGQQSPAELGHAQAGHAQPGHAQPGHTQPGHAQAGPGGGDFAPPPGPPASPANPHPAAPYAPPGYGSPQYAPATQAPPGYAPPGYASAPYPQPPPYRYAAAPPSPYAPYPPVPGAPPYGSGYPAGPPQRRSDPGLPMPVAVRPVPGTPFMVAVVGIAPTTSGRAVASLVAGVGSILVSFVVGCFGVLGSDGGWGPKVAGAFALLALFAGVASVVMGRMALREIRRFPEAARPRGRGIALSGLICGSSGIGLTVLGFLLALSLVNIE